MAGRLQGSALCLPGAVLAERVGGTWSQLRAVLEDGQTGPPAGRVEGHRPDAWQRAALEPSGPCPASGLWPSGGPLSACLAVLLTAWSRDQVPPIHPARDAQGDAAHRAGAARPLPGIRPVAPW